jgi:hypothetical protein
VIYMRALRLQGPLAHNDPATPQPAAKPSAIMWPGRRGRSRMCRVRALASLLALGWLRPALLLACSLSSWPAPWLLKPRYAVPDRNGKTQKYANPKGRTNRLDVHPRNRGKIADPTRGAV